MRRLWDEPMWCCGKLNQKATSELLYKLIHEFGLFWFENIKLFIDSVIPFALYAPSFINRITMQETKKHSLLEPKNIRCRKKS